MPQIHSNRTTLPAVRLPLLLVSLLTLALIALSAVWVVVPLSGDVAGAVRQASRSLQISSQIKDFRGQDLGSYVDETRYVVPLESVPARIQRAFIAAEDDQFWKHKGISLKGMVRAAIANAKRDRFAQGGSTITQQLVRQLLLPREKTLVRKLREIVLAITLERQMSKKEILGLWLNSVYLGNNSWGVEAAARHYFNKHVHQLSVAEGALIAGLPQAPSLYAPHLRPNLARKRQLYVLQRMKRLGWLKTTDYSAARGVKVAVQPKRDLIVDQVPWVTETARVELWKRLEQKNLPSSGLLVNTSINKDWQLDLQRLVDQKARTLPRSGLEIAIMVIDSTSGEIRSLVGGADFKQSQFNRAIDLDRPLGAAIYPLMFVWGVEKGLMSVDGYSSIAEAAVKSRFAEAEQIAPEIGYGVVREKLADLGFHVAEAAAVDELSGSPVSLARAYLGIGGSKQEVAMSSGLISSVKSDGQVLYSRTLSEASESLPNSLAWVMRQWMSIGSRVDSEALAGQPLLKSVKGWNAWWIIPRTDVVITAWVGSEHNEPQSPEVFKQSDRLMDDLLAEWMRRNLKPTALGDTPEGISFQLSRGAPGTPVTRIPLLIPGSGLF